MARSRWCTNRSKKFVASKKCLFGADDNTRGFTSANGIETQLGRTMGVRNRHYSWNSSVAHIGSQWIADDNAGAIPMISLGGQGYSEALVQEIVAGQHDNYWTSLFSSLGGVPGLFRPWMEMNGSHNAYNASATNFIDMWKHVYGVYTKIGRANLTWIWCPQQFDLKNEWPTFYPGDNYVDWVGLDLYRNFFDSAKPWYDFANAHKKPFCIPESGFEQGLVVKDKASGATADKDGSVTSHSLITLTQNAIKADYPNCVMYLVWNNVGPVGNDFIDTSKKSLEQYHAFAHDPYFA